MIKAGTMVKYFPKEIKSAQENFGIGLTVMDEEFIKREKLRGLLNAYREGYAEVYDLEPGTYVKLVSKGEGIIMSDTPMEIRTNREFIDRAHGNVLIAGLGMGLVLLSIQDKPEVKRIIVVEKYHELINFILPQIPYNKKLFVYTEDIFSFTLNTEIKFDTIYFDIWNEISGDNYPETKVLHKRFRKYLNRKENPNVWMDSWRRWDFKRKYFEHKRYSDDMARFNRAKISDVEELEKEFDKEAKNKVSL